MQLGSIRHIFFFSVHSLEEEAMTTSDRDLLKNRWYENI